MSTSPFLRSLAVTLLLVEAAGCGGANERDSSSGGSTASTTTSTGSGGGVDSTGGSGGSAQGGGGHASGSGGASSGGGGGSSDGGVPATLFGLGVQHSSSTFPLASTLGTLPVKGLRLWDSGVQWLQMETCDAATMGTATDPANPCYDWSTLDGYVNVDAPSQPMDVVLTFGAVPAWATAGTTQTPPSKGCSNGIDACLAPTDVNVDGTGADAMWSSFVTALTTRYHGKIAYYELWNEADSPNFWGGTTEQIVRMAKDAAAIIRASDSQAKILSPSFHEQTAQSWFADEFLAKGGTPTFDIVNFHGRAVGDNADADAFLQVYSTVEPVLQSLSLDALPLWDDEAGPLGGQVADSDANAAFVGRAYVVRASVGVARYYYAQWDGMPPNGLVHTIAATAYAVVADWLVGATVGACTPTGTQYRCPITRAGGYEGLILWDSSQTCTNGVCATVLATVDASFTRVRDLANGSTPISNATVSIGAKPVLVDNG